MSTGNGNNELTRLYRSAAREQSPAWLDEQILSAAARHARTRRTHTRLRMLAIAAVIAGLAITAGRWRSPDHDHASSAIATSIDPHSPLADALRNLRVVQVEPSVVASCLLRRDLCSDERVKPD